MSRWLTRALALLPWLAGTSASAMPAISMCKAPTVQDLAAQKKVYCVSAYNLRATIARQQVDETNGALYRVGDDVATELPASGKCPAGRLLQLIGSSDAPRAQSAEAVFRGLEGPRSTPISNHRRFWPARASAMRRAASASR